MRCLILNVAFAFPCVAQLDERLNAFSSRLPQVHETAFFEEGKINPAWKPARLYAPPAGGKPLLGQFKSGDELTLKIPVIPKHDRILICLELAILCHWDGVWETYGPDTWKASIKGGPTLLETTFSNFSRIGQNFPDETGFSTFPFQTAAASIGDLGFVEELGEKKVGWNNLDATYRIWLAASHSDPTVTFTFSGEFHDDPDQIDDWGDAGENWAVKSCRVWAVPGGNVPDKKMRTLAAASLVSAPGKAPDPAAHAVLVLSGTEAFPEIAAALREAGLPGLIPDAEDSPAAPADRDAIIAALASEDFATRERASERLATLLPEHREYLTQAAKTHDDPEVTLRIRKALSAFEQAANPAPAAAPSLRSLIPPRLLRLFRLLPENARRKWERGEW
jgi:hypothetical protein